MVKTIFFSAAGALLAIVATPDLAAAWTCAERAARCQELGGGAGCLEASRMASCKATHQYVAPSGRSWPVNGVPHGSRRKVK